MKDLDRERAISEGIAAIRKRWPQTVSDSADSPKYATFNFHLSGMDADAAPPKPEDPSKTVVEATTNHTNYTNKTKREREVAGTLRVPPAKT
jgi:hypothetical protein